MKIEITPLSPNQSPVFATAKPIICPITARIEGYNIQGGGLKSIINSIEFDWLIESQQYKIIA